MDLWLKAVLVDVVLMSGITLCFYAWDKRQAGRSGWRVPEKRLHLLSLLGGWPGALLGRRWLRHKSRKRRFRVVFWLTVFAHAAVVGGVTYLIHRSGK